MTYVAIVNKDGIAVAHSSVSLEGTTLTKQEDFAPLADEGPWKQIAALYGEDRFYEISLPIRDERTTCSARSA